VRVFQPTTGALRTITFVIKLDRRFSNGIGWLLAYTHAKSIDNTPYIGGTQLGDNDAVQILQHEGDGPFQRQTSQSACFRRR
jgi:hypothetical protein